MAAYATQLEFEAYVEGWETDDAAALGRYLERASRDVDRMVGPGWPHDEATGWRFMEDDSPLVFLDGLTAVQVRALKNATCAQANYLIEMGDAYFTKPRAKSITGPDFAIVHAEDDGEPMRYSSKAREELRDGGFLRAAVPWA